MLRSLDPSTIFEKLKLKKRTGYLVESAKIDHLEAWHKVGAPLFTKEFFFPKDAEILNRDARLDVLDYSGEKIGQIVPQTVRTSLGMEAWSKVTIYGRTLQNYREQDFFPILLNAIESPFVEIARIDICKDFVDKEQVHENMLKNYGFYSVIKDESFYFGNPKGKLFVRLYNKQKESKIACAEFWRLEFQLRKKNNHLIEKSTISNPEIAFKGLEIKELGASFIDTRSQKTKDSIEKVITTVTRFSGSSILALEKLGVPFSEIKKEIDRKTNPIAVKKRVDSILQGKLR